MRRGRITSTWRTIAIALLVMGAGAVWSGAAEAQNLSTYLERTVARVDIDFEGEGLKVRYIGRAPLPDTLVDRAQAVAEGTLQPDGTFEASLVQAKCASKYEAAYEEGKTAAE